MMFANVLVGIRDSSIAEIIHVARISGETVISHNC
jgi:hypothetical protein